MANQDNGPGTFGEFKEETPSVGQRAKNAVSEMATNVSEKASNMAADLSEKAHQAAEGMEDRADGAMASLGDRLTGAAESIRRANSPSGALGNTIEKVADGLATGGEYLTEHGVADLGAEVTALVRRYPVQSLWVGIGIGVLIGTAMSHRR